MKSKYILLLVVLNMLPVLMWGQKKIVVLSTNDTHSRIEALPETDSKYPNKAGVEARYGFVTKERAENPNVLLFDAGDFLQGTPYFNMFHGRAEADVMNMLKYDAGTIGNHEFDYGLDTLKMVFERLNHPIVCCNYDFSNTVLKDLVKPYITIKKDGIKIGVVGVGVDPEGLIQKDKYEGMIFNPVIESVNKYAKILKEKEKCDIVICLSHVGYNGDIKMAEQTQNINMIIGGHSHTFLEKPDVRKNLDNENVMIFQTGKNGIFMDKYEIDFEKIRIPFR